MTSRRNKEYEKTKEYKETFWKIKEFNDWIKRGCPINTKVTHLELQNKQISNLPLNIGNLPALKMICLDGNNLTELPDSIGNLTGLRCLYLHNNQLNTLPASIKNLTVLKHLSLHHNQLIEIPDIGNLDKLTYLTFDRCCRDLLRLTSYERLKSIAKFKKEKPDTKPARMIPLTN